MTQLPPSDDFLTFMDEDEGAASKATSFENHWTILIVDDEPDVHNATVFALKDTQILGRSLHFLHAYNSIEGEEILRTQRNIAVVLLDVVMETANAGLDLAAKIRNQYAIHDTRIILRTGEPNQAPEMRIIRDYDINDYKLKSELTQNRLYATLTAAIRGYRQIHTIDASKKGLDMILRSSSELLTQEGLQAFAAGVITHIAALISVPAEGIICVRRHDVAKASQLMIIAAAGDYCPLVDKVLCDTAQAKAFNSLQLCIDSRSNYFTGDGMALYLGSNARGDMSCYISSSQNIGEMEQSLLELFCGNIAICADNITYLEQLKNFAYRDTLVNLPNANALEQTMDEALLSGVGTHYSLALIDIDQFAEINAALGQEYGDKLLIATSERLKNRFHSPCFVARVAIDVFGVFGPSSHISDERLLAPFANPFEISGEIQILSVTAGIVNLSKMQVSGGEAIKFASIVLKKAKRNCRGQSLTFEPAMVDDARWRLNLLKELRNAFDRTELFLAFQPKLRADTLAVKGFEALLRWRNAKGQFISPVDFIPLAEQSGLIVRMGEWVLGSAMAALTKIHALGFTDATMAVNLSVAQLQHPDVIPMLKRVLGEFALSPSCIDLEVTESIAMGDINQNIAILNSIKDLGFSLSMDDFGTGFSSLSYLQKMPIDSLKIDKSFVQTMHTTSGHNIVQMIVQLGRTLNLNVVAEGVETEEQAAALRALSCDEMQGFLYAKPMAYADLTVWLESYARSHGPAAGRGLLGNAGF